MKACVAWTDTKLCEVWIQTPLSEIPGVPFMSLFLLINNAVLVQPWISRVNSDHSLHNSNTSTSIARHERGYWILLWFWRKERSVCKNSESLPPTETVFVREVWMSPHSHWGKNNVVQTGLAVPCSAELLGSFGGRLRNGTVAMATWHEHCTFVLTPLLPPDYLYNQCTFSERGKLS